MFRIGVQSSQWVVITLIVSLVVVISLVLGYLAVWTPRRDADEGAERFHLKSAVLWFLVLVDGGALVLGLIHTVTRIIKPPNW